MTSDIQSNLISRRQLPPRQVPWGSLFAGVILLLFGCSHVLFAVARDIGHSLPNTVFPFLTSRLLALVAATLELGLAIFCIRRRHERRVGVLVLTFVAVMLWYHWTLRYTDGRRGDCLGFLGRLLPISRNQEQTLSFLSLALMAFAGLMTLLPRKGGQRHRLGRSLGTLVGSVALSIGGYAAEGTPVIRVWGDVSLEEFNPLTGKVYPKQRWYSTFEARWRGNVWQTAVTNKANADWWVRQAYDGTNSYTLWRDGRITTNTPRAVVAPSPVPIPAGSGLLGDPLVPITYGWSPSTVVSNREGKVTMPVPWTAVRDNPEAWGYRWDIGKWRNRRFLQSFTVVRDSSLDLTDKEELFRFKIDYPDTRSDYTSYLKILALRKATVDGWVRARYRVTEWLHTNSLVLPLASRLEISSTAPRAKWPCRVFKLHALGISFRNEALDLPPSIDGELSVADYRYKRWNRKRIFKYAQYTLHSGDEWPGGDDPALLAQAADWLENGREYIRFVDDRSRWFAWGVLVVLLAPALLMWFRNTIQRRTTKQKGKE